MSNLFVFLLVVFAILQVLDIASTLKAIKSGNGEEGNPVAKELMRRFGVLGGAIVIKSIVLLPLTWYSWGMTLDALATTENILMLCAINAFFIYVVRNNFKIARA